MSGADTVAGAAGPDDLERRAAELEAGPIGAPDPQAQQQQQQQADADQSVVDTITQVLCFVAAAGAQIHPCVPKFYNPKANREIAVKFVALARAENWDLAKLFDMMGPRLAFAAAVVLPGVACYVEIQQSKRAERATPVDQSGGASGGDGVG